MAGSPSNRVHRQVHRLFNFGAVGAMSDAQLLDRFVTRRDDVAEAVFEELVIRHGPMVLRVCRGVLHDAHDAEDAFQAVFLVLANRARSIRRSDSVASWLFGVAQRVATRARRSAARRHKLNDVAAERASETDLTAENDPDWEALLVEIDRLPERLRAPIVLCYLEGLTYAVAAQNLGVSEMAIRGRLARARERLRHRLTRRGVMVPSGLLAAGAAGEAQAAIPLTLIHSTSRIALKFVMGNTVAVLARGVMNSMLLNRLKVAAVFMFLGVAGSYWAWHGLAGAADEQGRGNSGPVVVPPTASAPASKPESQPAPPAVTYQITGSVRVEGTGEPVKGAQFFVVLGDVVGSSNPDRVRTVTSGPDGQFLLDLPPGQATAWTFQAPVGYWAPENWKSRETFVLSRSQPIHRKDYVVRRGTVWPFYLVGTDGKPVPGHIRVTTNNEIFLPEADNAGRVNLTLPSEAGSLMAAASKDKLQERSFASIANLIPMEWAAGFRSDVVKTIERIGHGYRLTDDGGRIATIGDSAVEIPEGAGAAGGVTIAAPARVKPILVDGKLVIRVLFFDTGRMLSGSLSGQIVDEGGRPIEGARVAPAFHVREGNGNDGVFPDDKEHEATTDRQGRFLIRAIPRGNGLGGPSILSLVVRKDGFASLETRAISFHPGVGDSPHVLEPIRLEPGVSLIGTVVDPQGQPAEGVWVEPSGSFALRSEFTRTDATGKFTLHNLPKGMVQLSFAYGSLAASGKYLADGKNDGLKITLRPPP